MTDRCDTCPHMPGHACEHPDLAAQQFLPPAGFGCSLHPGPARRPLTTMLREVAAEAARRLADRIAEPT